MLGSLAGTFIEAVAMRFGSYAAALRHLGSIENAPASSLTAESARCITKRDEPAPMAPQRRLSSTPTIEARGVSSRNGLGLLPEAELVGVLGRESSG